MTTEGFPNGAGERPEIYDVPRDLGDVQPTPDDEPIEMGSGSEVIHDHSAFDTVVVHFTEGDLQDLMNGEEMTWGFTLKDGKRIELLLTTSDEHAEQ